MPQLYSTQLTSPVGALRLVASDTGLRGVLWPQDETARRVILPELEEKSDHPILSEAERQLAEYFAGTRREFDLPLELRGTSFQVAVWRALCEIPFGETRSYSEVAQTTGRPDAVRAVAAAIGRNPISIVVPCHRVVGKNGSLTGFAGGLEAKKWLLDWEGAKAIEIPGRCTGLI